MKRTMAAAAFTMTAMMGLGFATAADDSFGLSPAACHEVVSNYLDDRLYDSRSARIQLDGEPYKVMVDLRGSDTVAAWAQDIRVKSRLPSGSWSNYQPYTVIFQNGEAVALESDVSDVTAI